METIPISEVESEQEKLSGSDMDQLQVEKPSYSPMKRSSFIMPSRNFALPQLTHQKSETKMSKKGINIFVRFRPDSISQQSKGQHCITYHPNQRQVTVRSDGSSYPFKFKRIFPAQATQQQMFMSAGLPLTQSILQGYNSAIIAYGQTGAGKTHTLLGPGYDRPQNIGKVSQELRGVAPRLIQSLFHQIFSSFSGDVVYRVYASYIQIYLEKIHDLLNPAKEKLTVYQDLSKGLWVSDATKVPTKNVQEVLKLLQLGTKYRVTAQTNSNKVSSRSHALLVLTITKHLSLEGKYRASQVYMVDLCGSERISKTGAQEMRLTQAQNINRSLLALGNVIAALSERRKHIPYRDSKLTLLLQNCFGGNSLTSLILCCSSNSVSSLETLSTLRFGDRANLVHNKPVINQRQSVDDLRRLLMESNAKILAQQRVIRNQNEKMIEMEIIMHELYQLLGTRESKSFQSKFQINIPLRSRNIFDRLSINVFSYMISFLHPRQIIGLFYVCKLFYEKLKSDTIWRGYLRKLKGGMYRMNGIGIQDWPQLDEITTTYWEAFVKVSRNKYKKKELSQDPEGLSSGLHLFPNLNPQK